MRNGVTESKNAIGGIVTSAGNFLAYAISIFSSLIFLLMIYPDPFMALPFAVCGILIFPPSKKYFQEKLNWKFGILKTIGIVISVFILAAITNMFYGVTYKASNPNQQIEQNIAAYYAQRPALIADIKKLIA